MVGYVGTAAAGAVVVWPATCVMETRATRAKRVDRAIRGPIEQTNRQKRKGRREKKGFRAIRRQGKVREKKEE